MSKIKVQILYFAKLASDCGLQAEWVETDSTNGNELFAELSARYPISLNQKSLRLAINESFVAWESTLAEGDVIALIPPVAGG